MKEVVRQYIATNEVNRILELGVGTGLTSEKLLELMPDASLTAVDFSKQMMKGAKDRLTDFKVKFVLGDYSEIELENNFEIVASVISIHHQTHEGKRKLFKKIYDSLKSGGIFIFGDLATYKDKKKAVVNDAQHYNHLVENACNEQSLEEWSYHHKFLNLLTPIEDQIEWLKGVGFSKVDTVYENLNTILIIAKK